MSGWGGRRLHFVGIGGAGMSGLALVCARLGAAVSGSDRADSSYMERLRAAGLEPAVGHDAANLPEGAEVVVSTAIGEDNPELRARPRAAASSRPPRRAAGRALRREATDRDRRHPRQDDDDRDARLGAARDRRRPRLLRRRRGAGAGPEGEAANAGWGEGEWVVAEADESDASFLRAGARDRRDHQRRDGPPLALGLDGGAAGGVRALRRPGARAGPPATRMPGSTGGEVAASTPAPGRPSSRWPFPARTTCSTPAPRSPPPSSPASTSMRRPRRSPSFPGVQRRLELKGERGGARDLRRLRPSPDRGARGARGVAGAGARAA